MIAESWSKASSRNINPSVARHRPHSECSNSPSTMPPPNFHYSGSPVTVSWKFTEIRWMFFPRATLTPPQSRLGNPSPEQAAMRRATPQVLFWNFFSNFFFLNLNFKNFKNLNFFPNFFFSFFQVFSSKFFSQSVGFRSCHNFQIFEKP